MLPQTKKGSQWYFGMINTGSDVIHNLTCTSANINDAVKTNHLFHCGEEYAFDDAGYIDIKKRNEPKYLKISAPTDCSRSVKNTINTIKAHPKKSLSNHKIHFFNDTTGLKKIKHLSDAP